MTFVNPGRLYLQKNSKIEPAGDVLAYANFLHLEIGLEGKLPVEVEKIFHQFDILQPKFAPLPDQQGLLTDAMQGIILVNPTTPKVAKNLPEYV